MYRILLNALIWFSVKKWRVALVDLFCIALALFIGFIELIDAWTFLRVFVVFSALVIGALFAGKTYKIVWTRASIEEYLRFAHWYLAGVLIFIIVSFFSDMLKMPKSPLLILFSLAIIFMTGARGLWRFAAVTHRRHGDVTQRALIAGAGEAGAMIARDLRRNPIPLEAVGFIDDNPALVGMTVASLKVLGSRKDIPNLIRHYAIDTVLLTMPSASSEVIRAYIDILSKEKVTLRILPRFSALADGKVTVSRLRSVNLEDLLSRDAVVLDSENIFAVIKDKTVLVTGAGGSIGSEICRQALALKPKQLLALGHGEQSIYLLLESLSASGATIPVIPIIADVADEKTMQMIFEKHRPEVVFHAGAHKHIPLMEENPCEALRVNALGTWNIARLSGLFDAERFVMISTDKAVHPTSIMGATKRAAERLLLSAQEEYPSTRFIAVRFGNVLGSRGSVVPKFERQIAAGGPVTVTHPDMERYFMLIPEAVSLVFQAAAMGKGGELYALDMGQPVKISEMAETLIRLHGYEPYRDIEIKYTGIRPGEKLHEELFYNTDHVATTAHAKIFQAKSSPKSEDVLGKVLAILKKAEENKLTASELRESILSLGSEEDCQQSALQQDAL